jgi:hypothetical protein
LIAEGVHAAAARTLGPGVAVSEAGGAVTGAAGDVAGAATDGEALPQAARPTTDATTRPIDRTKVRRMSVGTTLPPLAYPAATARDGAIRPITARSVIGGFADGGVASDCPGKRSGSSQYRVDVGPLHGSSA